MATPMRFSTGLPNAREGRQNTIGSVDRKAIQRQAVVAEECGYYALWPNEFFSTPSSVSARYAEPPNLHDAIVSMSFAAAVTERIRIMPSTIVLPLHEPILLAHQLATLDALSGGRITLGIGLGGDKEEYGRMRQGNPNRSKVMDEYVQAMRVLWSERRASYAGKYVQFSEIESYPKPVQSPFPIFRAGHGEEVFKWIARDGQGWIDSQFNPDEMKGYVDKLGALAVEAGRGGERFEIARQWYVSIAETEAEAQAVFAASYPPATQGAPAAPAAPIGGAGRGTTAAERTLIGTPDQILPRLREYLRAGVTEMCVIFYSESAESAERQTRLFAREVMARF